MESAGEGRKGQASTEFLTMFSVSLMVLLVSVLIYFMHTIEAQDVENALDATSLCLRVSTTMSSFYTLGEGAEHTLDLPEFYISCYPITNAQYRPFVEDGGYENASYWTDEGWAWRSGAEADLSALDEDLRKTDERWLAQRPREKQRLFLRK